MSAATLAAAAAAASSGMGQIPQFPLNPATGLPISSAAASMPANLFGLTHAGIGGQSHLHMLRRAHKPEERALAEHAACKNAQTIL